MIISNLFQNMNRKLFLGIKFPFCKKIKNDKTPIPRNQIKKMLDDKDSILKRQTTSTGPGGQHVNKTCSAVILKHLETNISVKASNSRDSLVNYGKAKQRLVDKLDQHFNGNESKIAKKIEKISKQKDKARKRSQLKHSNNNNDTKK
jgi:protein subunit release factor B